MKITMNYSESIQDVFERFILLKKACGLADKTISTYSQQFNSLSPYLDLSLPIDTLTDTDLSKMINQMRDSGLSANTIRSYTRNLKVFLTWCNQENITEINIKKYKGEETIKETYSDDELKTLLKKPNFKSCSFVEYRSWVIVNFLVNGGSRAATIRNIKIKDVNLDNCVIYARHTKNKKPLVIPLCSELAAILNDYLRIRRGNSDDYLFCTQNGSQLTENALRKSISVYNKSRGVQKTSIHLFRHTFAKKYLVDCGGNAFALQKLLGHSTLDMTKHYCAIFDSEVTKDFDNFSPLSNLNMQKKKIKMN